MTKAGIVYLTMADQKYPQKLAFVFLTEIAQLFLLELQNTYGTASGVDYLSKIETIDSQYSFLKFGKVTRGSNNVEKAINKKKRDFKDVNAAENISKLNKELMDVSGPPLTQPDQQNHD